MEKLKKVFRCSYVYILFIAVVIAFFVSQGRNLGFDNYPHGYLSAHGMALSANLLKVDSFFMFNSISLQDQLITFDAYNRFPPIPFVIIGKVISLADTYELQIYLARQITGLFFILSMIFVFLLSHLLLADKRLALATVFAVFGSYYFLHYSNMVFSDIFSLCCFTGLLYLIIRIKREKSIHRGIFLCFVAFAAFIGWQSGAVLALWVCVEFINKVRGHKNSFGFSVIAFVLFAFLSIGMFSWQLFYESCISRADFWQLSTVKSVLFRLGIAESAAYENYTDRLSFSYFIMKEGFRIIRLLIPLYLEMYWSEMTAVWKLSLAIYALFVAGVFCFMLRKSKGLLKPDEMVILLLSGFFWTLPMRMHVAFHDFQAIFYIGISLAFYLLLFSRGKKYAGLILGIMSAIFILNICLASADKYDKQKATSFVSYEFDFIVSKLPEGSTVHVVNKEEFADIGNNTGSYPLHVFDYYLSGFVYAEESVAEYIIAAGRDYNKQILTNNKRFNLFRR